MVHSSAQATCLWTGRFTCQLLAGSDPKGIRKFFASPVPGTAADRTGECAEIDARWRLEPAKNGKGTGKKRVKVVKAQHSPLLKIAPFRCLVLKMEKI